MLHFSRVKLEKFTCTDLPLFLEGKDEKVRPNGSIVSLGGKAELDRPPRSVAYLAG